MRFVQWSNGQRVPALGLGTWRMGESPRARKNEVQAVMQAFETGYRLIDTAEMYGDGGAESVVGEAIQLAINAGSVRREELIVVTKVLPSHATRDGVVRACERSLKRLAIDTVDLYLLHWRGATPLKETVAAFEQLRNQGRIQQWGVSNFDTSDMQQLWSFAEGRRCIANQVYYSASARDAEFDLFPWHREHSVVTMAYSPIDQGALARDATFDSIGRRHGISATSAALAWVLRQPDMIAIPMSGSAPHLRENFAAASVDLTAEDLAQVDAQFPPTKRKRPLATT
ncbi:MAG: aldo/keto reductase [Burkholderiaceae bacterium]|nr:aldo/keto reductase [Burkholderiaceae bacterium]